MRDRWPTRRRAEPAADDAAAGDVDLDRNAAARANRGKERGCILGILGCQAGIEHEDDLCFSAVGEG